MIGLIHTGYSYVAIGRDNIVRGIRVDCPDGDATADVLKFFAEGYAVIRLPLGVVNGLVRIGKPFPADIR